MGGAPFNVAWNLHVLGQKPQFISAVGGDEEGEKILRCMSQNNLSTESVQCSEYPTGTVKVSIVNDEPRYEILPEQAFDHIEYDRIQSDSASAAILYHGSLIWRNSVSRQSLMKLRTEISAPVFVDLNIREPWFEMVWVPEILNSATVLKLNKDELKTVTGLIDSDETSIKDAALSLRRKYEISQIWVTAGSEGAWLFDEEGHMHFEAVPAVNHFVDAVGAGDAFAACVISGFLNELPAPETLRHAVRFAARICQIRGATSDDLSIYSADL
ncbi:MAG: fructokinase [Mariniblastus sp.]